MNGKNDYKIELLLDGKKIGLNPYVKSVFYNVITGMVGTLKNISAPKKIEVTIEKEG